MARTRAAPSMLARTAERMVGQIEELVADITALRRENEALRAEVNDAVQLLERAGSALGGKRSTRPAAAAKPAGKHRKTRKRKAAKGRATPPEVTTEVVRVAIAKLGEATAAEVAAEITKAGAPVSGRAVRFIAERAGAVASVGEDGQRRYRVG